MNTETKQFEGHTPGPWRVIDDPDDPGYEASNTLAVVDDEGYVITDVYNAGEKCGDEDLRTQSQANAALIASAPELLKELNEERQHVLNFQNKYINEARQTDILRKEANEAIRECGKLKSLNAELLEALKGLYTSFQHIEGNERGNKAKTDIIKFNQSDVAPALTSAREAIAKAEGRATV